MSTALHGLLAKAIERIKRHRFSIADPEMLVRAIDEQLLVAIGEEAEAAGLEVPIAIETTINDNGRWRSLVWRAPGPTGILNRSLDIESPNCQRHCLTEHDVDELLCALTAWRDAIRPGDGRTPTELVELMYALDKLGPTTVLKLADELNVNEKTVRSRLRCLKKEVLAIGTRGNHALSDKGRRLMLSL